MFANEDDLKGHVEDMHCTLDEYLERYKEFRVPLEKYVENMEKVLSSNETTEKADDVVMERVVSEESWINPAHVPDEAPKTKQPTRSKKDDKKRKSLLRKNVGAAAGEFVKRLSNERFRD